MIDELIAKVMDKLTFENMATAGLLFLTAFISALVAYWRTVEK